MTDKLKHCPRCFDIECCCAPVDLEEENKRLRAEVAALKYSLQLDEDLIGMIQKIISKRPEKGN